jgi:cytochrome c553
MKRLIMAFAITAVTALTVSAADVEANWKKHCLSCHGKDGSGQTRMGKKAGAKDYRDPKVQAEIKADEALKNVKEGMKEDGKEKMKPFADKLTDDEIKELIAYIKKFEKK